MKYDLSAFSPKDRKLIKDNDGKNPSELFDLGLSKTGYERLLKMDSLADSAKQQPVQQEQQPKKADGPIRPHIVENVNQPKIKKEVAANGVQKKVRVPGGNIVDMAAAQADRFTTLYPNEYQIVD